MQTATPFPSSEHSEFHAGASCRKEKKESALVVSIHDVSTVNRETVVRMLEDLAGVGVGKTSLLVIPNHHHKGEANLDRFFGAWLRDMVSHGHEAVLHGFFHLRPAQEDDGLSTRLTTRFYTAGEGEFYDLSFEEARSLLHHGKQVLFACGVTPSGFIAPAWLLSPEAERAVREEGFDYTTKIASVIDCKRRVEFSSRSMVYSVRSNWRRSVSLLWNGMLFQLLRNTSLLRIGLHPPDWEHDAIRRHVLGCIRLAAKARRVETYREWLDHWRSEG